MEYTGIYSTKWAGYSFLQWSRHTDTWHEGIDYNFGAGSQDLGKSVWACGPGRVVFVGKQYPGFGEYVIIRHTRTSRGTVFSHYAHLNTDSVTVLQNDTVEAGDVVGSCGKTGWLNMSPHLHFSIRNKYMVPGFHPKGMSKSSVAKLYYDPFKFFDEENEHDKMEYMEELDQLKAENRALDKELKKLREEIDRINRDNAAKVGDLGQELAEKNKIIHDLKIQSEQKCGHLTLSEIVKLVFNKYVKRTIS